MEEKFLARRKENLAVARMVLLDYKAGIKEAWKRLGSQDVLSWLWVYIWVNYWLSWEDIEQDSLLIGEYAVIVCVVFFGFMLSRMYPSRLEKILLLSPLTKEEKTQYLKTGYRIRIALPMGVYLLAGGIWLFFGAESVFHFAWIGLWLFFYLGCINIYCQPKSGKDAFERKYYPIGGLEGFIAAALFLTLAVLVGADMLIGKGTKAFGAYCYAIVFTILQILLYRKMKTAYYPKILERAVSYEDNY